MKDFPSMSEKDWIKGRESQLTEVGKREHYLIGREIRRRYMESDSPLLSKEYNDLF